IAWTQVDVVIQEQHVTVGPGFAHLLAEFQEALELVEEGLASWTVVLGEALLARLDVPTDAAIPVAIRALLQQSPVQGFGTRSYEYEVRPQGGRGSRRTGPGCCCGGACRARVGRRAEHRLIETERSILKGHPAVLWGLAGTTNG